MSNIYHLHINQLHVLLGCAFWPRESSFFQLDNSLFRYKSTSGQDNGLENAIYSRGRCDVCACVMTEQRFAYWNWYVPALCCTLYIHTTLNLGNMISGIVRLRSSFFYVCQRRRLVIWRRYRGCSLLLRSDWSIFYLHSTVHQPNSYLLLVSCCL